MDNFIHLILWLAITCLTDQLSQTTVLPSTYDYFSFSRFVNFSLSKGHRRTRQGAGEAAAPESGKAIIIRANAKFFGQKPAAKECTDHRPLSTRMCINNEQMYARWRQAAATSGWRRPAIF